MLVNALPDMSTHIVGAGVLGLLWLSWMVIARLPRASRIVLVRIVRLVARPPVADPLSPTFTLMPWKFCISWNVLFWIRSVTGTAPSFWMRRPGPRLDPELVAPCVPTTLFRTL